MRHAGVHERERVLAVRERADAGDHERAGDRAGVHDCEPDQRLRERRFDVHGADVHAGGDADGGAGDAGVGRCDVGGRLGEFLRAESELRNGSERQGRSDVGSG